MELRCTKGFAGGSTCTLQCLPGYVRTGVATLNCGRTGEWSDPVPACLQRGVWMSWYLYVLLLQYLLTYKMLSVKSSAFKIIQSFLLSTPRMCRQQTKIFIDFRKKSNTKFSEAKRPEILWWVVSNVLKSIRVGSNEALRQSFCAQCARMTKGEADKQLSLKQVSS